jgi:hypothetical protein
MDETKGVPIILQAWLKMATQFGSTCPPLWLVGGELSEIESIRGRVDPSVLADYESAGLIKWWGYLDAAGISTLMLKAYVLVTHSVYEPGGRVVLEAMTQGIPVIATPHGFAIDLITDWHGGFLVSYGDVETLRRRMEHFMLQPLLRHAMGKAAQMAACLALEQWDFMNTHLQIYEYASQQMVAELKTATERSLPVPADGPRPKGFNGVYPFEGEAVDVHKATEFLARTISQSDIDLVEIKSSSGRSRVWLASCADRRWVVKHAFSVYRTRPMWDRGYAGDPVETQSSRIKNELLASSCCPVVASIIAADPCYGLTLLEWLEPVELDDSTLSDCASVLLRFHGSKHVSFDFRSVREFLNRDWHKMDDQQVIDELNKLDTRWRIEGRRWNAWQPMSIRLAWRWLRLGLNKGWILFPSSHDLIVDGWLSNEEMVAATQEESVIFGLCHGDASLANFRRDPRGNVVLIDCERLHPGYFGHDWASLVLDFLDASTNGEEMIWKALRTIDPVLCPRWLLLSWLKWITVTDLCRAHALIKARDIEVCLLRWQRLELFDKLFVAPNR